jgi:hypothetical protein
MAAPRNVCTVSYFPAGNSGYSMWPDYDGPLYQSDMRLAASLGFTTVRIFLAARPGVFDFPDPTSAQLACFTDFCGRSAAAKISLHITLYDLWQDYGLIAGARTWAQAIIDAVPDLAAVQCIELQNETRYASAAAYSGGFDSGWPSGTPQYGTTGQVAIVWAQQLIPYIRSIAAGVDVTASAASGTADLAAFYASVDGTSAQPSWYEWHCYTGKPSTTYAAVSEVMTIVKDPAQLVVGECGLTSAAEGAQGTAQAQQAQADYIQSVRWACQQLGLSEPGLWALLDLNASGQFPGGQEFGLFTARYEMKPAGQMYASIKPGSVIPAVGINGGMRGAAQTDAYGNALPAEWSVYRGNQGAQPIRAAIDSAITYEGLPSILLTGSAETSGGDNPPALRATPCTWPLVTGQAGQQVTFSIALRASGPYAYNGRWPNLEISWYSYTRGYVSSANGSYLGDLTGTFARYSLTATVPPDADFAELLVNVGYNAGSIWAAGATWAGPGGAVVNCAGQWW